MVFVNEAQRRACFAKMRRYNEKGKVSPWDCFKYAKGENVKKSKKKSSSKRKSYKRSSSPKRQIFTGPKGGRYYISRNRKVYI